MSQNNIQMHFTSMSSHHWLQRRRSFIEEVANSDDAVSHSVAPGRKMRFPVHQISAVGPTQQQWRGAALDTLFSRLTDCTNISPQKSIVNVNPSSTP